MKAFRILIVLALVMAVFGLSIKPVAAQLFPSYITGTQVMNVGLATANITITYYDGAGNIVGSTNPGEQIGSFQSKTYFPPASGSAVISSDQPLAAVTNVQDSFTETAAAAYVGASAGSTSVSLPLLMKANNNNYTWYTVQNAGSSDSTVTVSYSDCGGVSNPNPAAVVIKPGAGFTYYQQNETCHSGKVFSAQLSATQPVVAVVIQEQVTPYHILNAYSGFPKGATNPVLPLINSNNNGTVTGVQIQNFGGTASNVTLSYTPSIAGAACTETQNIPAGSSKTYALAAFTNGPNATTTCAGGARFVGSARVTGNSAGVPLTAVVNQLNFVTQNGEAYAGSDPADATGTVVLPLIRDRHTVNNYFTGFSVMNIGPAATNIKCTFSNSTYVATAANVAQYSALVDLQAGKIAVGYVGSAVCKGYTNNTYSTVDPAAKLVAIVNQLGNTPPDRFLVYEGTNIP